ncbi:MAG TPA: L-threonylcarbamoyladenylate synthase [Candidatus Limnocylindrales bacterium]|nr:L-threonylcarbamoyladenylate synthase [Candidatus Limnocylindrales bacterium]
MVAHVVPDGTEGRAEAVRVLAAGGLVGFPTDTVYGIAVSSRTPGGLARLFAAKRRPPDRAIVLLLADAEQASELGILGPAGEALAGAFWPGGLTLIVRQRGDTVPALSLATGDDPGAGRTVGLRVPDHSTPRALAAAVGPLPTTSANRSGDAEARDAHEVLHQLGSALDLILDGGPARGPRPSTVIDVSGETPRILRDGAVSADAIAATLRAAGIDAAGLRDPVGR